ncbi:Bifunctional folate synthesis protein, partial [human gut metagenome]
YFLLINKLHAIPFQFQYLHSQDVFQWAPKELVRALLNIESEMKRERIIKWGPRIIDLDVVFYDDLISDDEEIILP